MAYRYTATERTELLIMDRKQVALNRSDSDRSGGAGDVVRLLPALQVTRKLSKGHQANRAAVPVEIYEPRAGRPVFGVAAHQLT
ncbi:hypothetical protein ZHAS_00016952 [Anopheles sinensis]|uniref:Uncharacterized protein n=1 Tax=Anopheles sinensis TaxID=74873 RepID=A0A084WFF8_ANOSI|nr:hypothetical protein ZHAS_00016952 [Anopheles sinensis]